MKGKIIANVSVKEIYDKLCPECKDKFVKLVAERVGEAQIKKALEGKGEQSV